MGFLNMPTNDINEKADILKREIANLETNRMEQLNDNWYDYDIDTQIQNKHRKLDRYNIIIKINVPKVNQILEDLKLEGIHE